MPGPIRDANDRRKFSNALRLQDEQRFKALSQRLVDGEITVSEWQAEFKVLLRDSYMRQLIAGNGGVEDGITRRERLAIGPALQREYRYLGRFANAVEQAIIDGKSVQFAVERGAMYARKSQSQFWKKAIPVKLSQVPRDGKTKCKTNCKCRLDFQYERNTDDAITAVLVYWRLSPAEHCEDCLKLARTWNPLRIETDGINETSIARAIDVSQDDAHKAVGILKELVA